MNLEMLNFNYIKVISKDSCTLDQAHGMMFLSIEEVWSDGNRSLKKMKLPVFHHTTKVF